MTHDLLKELEQCLTKVNSPILKHLDSGTPFDPNHFANMLDLLQLEVSEDLNTLYMWKPGVKKELINAVDFNIRLFEQGSHIEYTEALQEYQVLVLAELFENRYLPFIMMPGLGSEDPTLIDLSKSSKTFGQIFFFSSAMLVTKPTSIYDSLNSMIETILTCHREGVYIFSEEGFLLTDSKKEAKISSRINKRSVFWKEYF